MGREGKQLQVLLVTYIRTVRIDDGWGQVWACPTALIQVLGQDQMNQTWPSRMTSHRAGDVPALGDFEGCDPRQKKLQWGKTREQPGSCRGNTDVSRYQGTYRPGLAIIMADGSTWGDEIGGIDAPCSRAGTGAIWLPGFSAAPY